MNFDIAPALAAAVRLPGPAPLTVVFASAPYLDVLDNWIGFARRAAAPNVFIAALDRPTLDFARARRLATARIDGIGGRGELWVARAALFAALAAEGRDFIHSDADAIWLSSPVEEAFAPQADIAFSSGTVWPGAVTERWGFVVCCGLFAVRATPASAAFFAEVAERARVCGDDQIAVNQALLESGVVWDDGVASEERAYGGQPFRIFPQTIVGQSPALKVALLSHRRFPRLAELSPDTVVAHPVSPSRKGEPAAERVQRSLDALGLWRPAAATPVTAPARS